MPADVNAADMNRITEEQAWLCYTMGGRATKANLQTGVNVFLRGKLWDLGSDGRITLLHNDSLQQAPAANTASLTNVWLE